MVVHSWRVETTQPRTECIDVFGGETMRLQAAIYTRSEALVFAEGATATLCWQAPGMGSSWWSAPASIDGNEIVADWLPEYGGGPEYEVFLAVESAGASYRAVAQLTIRHAPGEIPNELPLPQRKIDFALVEIEHAPWSLSSHNHGKSDILGLTTDLAAKANRVADPVEGHLAALDSDGDPADSGIALADGQIPAAKVGGLAAVATSGAYSDLAGKPTIPTSLKCPKALSIVTYSQNGMSSSTSYDGSTARSLTVYPECRPILALSKMGSSALSLAAHRVYTYTATAGLPTGSGTVSFWYNGNSHVFGTLSYWPSTMSPGMLEATFDVTDPDNLTGIPKGLSLTTTVWPRMTLAFMGSDNMTSVTFASPDFSLQPAFWGGISILGRSIPSQVGNYLASAHTAGVDSISLGCPAQDCTIIANCIDSPLAVAMAQPQVYPYFVDDAGYQLGTLSSGYVYRLDIDSVGTVIRSPQGAMLNGYLRISRYALRTS